MTKTAASVDPKFADLADSARFSGYSKRQLYEFVRSGALPAYRPGNGKLLIDLDELSKFIKSCPHNPTRQGLQEVEV